jgi:hypothetical protein
VQRTWGKWEIQTQFISENRFGDWSWSHLPVLSYSGGYVAWNEMEIIWTKVVWYLKTCSQNLPEETGGKLKKKLTFHAVTGLRFLPGVVTSTLTSLEHAPLKSQQCVVWTRLLLYECRAQMRVWLNSMEPLNQWNNNKNAVFWDVLVL